MSTQKKKKNQSSKSALVKSTCGPCTHYRPGPRETEEFLHVTIRRSLFFSLELSPEACATTELGTGLWSYSFRSVLAVRWLLYSSELKVSYREWPLETYYWPLSRWLDVFKELLHSNRIQSRWLYLLLSQESGKKIKRLNVCSRGG